MDTEVEREVCANCKKEIPHHNYVMHTMHCARNITLCKNCNEPIPKLEYEQHREACKPKPPKKPSPPPLAIEKSNYFQSRKAVEDAKAAKRKELYMKKHEHLIDNGFSLKESVNNGLSSCINSSRSLASSSSSISSGSTGSTVNSSGTNYATRNASSVPNYGTRDEKVACQQSAPLPQQQFGGGGGSSKSSGLLACRYCDLELPKLELEEHENYCGTRTDKCLECGELVMYKNKQVHLDSNHGFVKLRDEPGPRPSWDSSTQRGAASASSTTSDYAPRRRFERLRLDDTTFDPTPYLPSTYLQGFNSGPKKKEGESYKEISRRLDCPAPQPPIRRRNPPTELTIPCEFCDTPIPHEELILHETGCRPDLARLRLRRNRPSTPEDDDYSYTASSSRDYNTSNSARDYSANSTRDYSANSTRDYNSGVATRADYSATRDYSTSSAARVGEYSPSTPRDYGSREERDDEELPCEFCDHMIPASELWKHQLQCTPA